MRRRHLINLKLAYAVAIASLHKGQKMGAVIAKGKRVLRVACNGRVTGRHAEIRAISRDTDFSGATIYVARSNGRVSRPCRTCLRLIRQAKLRQMVFVNEQGRTVVKLVKKAKDSDYKDMESLAG